MNIRRPILLELKKVHDLLLLDGPRPPPKTVTSACLRGRPGPLRTTTSSYVVNRPPFCDSQKSISQTSPKGQTISKSLSLEHSERKAKEAKQCT